MRHSESTHSGLKTKKVHSHSAIHDDFGITKLLAAQATELHDQLATCIHQEISPSRAVYFWNPSGKSSWEHPLMDVT